MLATLLVIVVLSYHNRLFINKNASRESFSTLERFSRFYYGLPIKVCRFLGVEIGAMESPIIIEYRPLLRSCQVFVKRTFDPVNTVITVTNENQVILGSEAGHLIIQLPESVTLEPEILSAGVSFLPQLVHFRVIARPPCGTGSFKAEVLLGTNGLNKSSTSTRYIPDAVIDQPTRLLCRTCETVLNQNEPTVVFTRILPLPDNEESEFFCHPPPVDAGGDTMTIDPRSSRDILYGLYFFRLHSNTVDGSAGVVNCPKCRSWLGCKTDKYVQFFNSTVYFEGCNSVKTTDCTINDFLGIMDVLSRVNNVFMNKIVLHCDVDNHTKKYLLLWIFDRDLSLFTANDQKTDGDVIRMKEEKVAKILYSLQLGATDLVSQWLSSQRVSCVPVALPVLERGFAYLEKMAEAIPSVFSKAYDMNLTYVVKAGL